MDIASLLKKRKRGAIGISNEATVEECVSLLAGENLGALIVYDAHGKIVGILSERDIVQGLAKWGGLVLNRCVAELMTSKVITCKPKENLKDLMSVMINREFRHLPVVEDGKVINVISMRDLVRERIAEMELENNVLRDLALTRPPI